MLPKTKQVLDTLAKHDFFKSHDVKFVGGTALSYLINHRLSEDLDFAMLELCRDEIGELMHYYGGEMINHHPTAVDYAKNEGGDMYDYYLKYMLDGVKVEFFSPPFNILEKEIWTKKPTSLYENSHLKLASFETIMYMKSMAFWNRRKYRDLFDIHYALTNVDHYSVNDFLDPYLKYNITYTKEILYTKIKSKAMFYEKQTDEGLSTLVSNPKSYEWYRNQLESILYDAYLKELYSQ